MADTEERALLPAGMADWLPPAAEHEAWAVETLIGVFRAWGYERVKPPLMEFEDSLLAGPGRAVADNTFRLMDPVSQRMMGLRADVTVQVARIATARLGAWPRPLRLAYAGQVMRVRGSQLRPTRQFGQVGAELIGPDTPDADAEAIVLAARAVRRLGVSDLSVDLGLPTLVPAICRGARVDDDTARRLRDALDRKDAAAVAALEPQLGEAVCALMAGLLNSVGAAESALAQLTDLDLSGEAASWPMSPWSAPSGATRARARSSTGCRRGPT
jgi:ATP phosphoribosyltransferase regulatory subunit